MTLHPVRMTTVTILVSIPENQKIPVTRAAAEHVFQRNIRKMFDDQIIKSVISLVLLLVPLSLLKLLQC